MYVSFISLVALVTFSRRFLLVLKPVVPFVSVLSSRLTVNAPYWFFTTRDLAWNFCRAAHFLSFLLYLPDFFLNFFGLCCCLLAFCPCSFAVCMYAQPVILNSRCWFFCWEFFFFFPLFFLFPFFLKANMVSSDNHSFRWALTRL